ncbi:MAG TPA: hypothetical protein VLB84_20195 [Bacteroidia bacterium]|jgi:hypothetical protein|nr:hypothetical protein [Bacteroidia bacterium]
MNLKTTLSLTFALFLFFIITPKNVKAQVKYFKGYVVLLNGDTLNGEIKKNLRREYDNYTKASFRKADKGEQKTYRPDKIKEYVVDGVTFVSRNVDGEQMFVKRLSKGTVNLYEAQVEVLQMNELKVKSDYYMEREAGEFVKIKSGKFKKQIVDVMGDNEEIVKGLEEKKYDYDNILEVFNTYNKPLSN